MNFKLNTETVVPRKMRKSFENFKRITVMEDRESPEYFRKRRELLQQQKIEILKRYASKAS